MIYNFYIAEGDTSPEISIQCQDYAGNAVDVSGASVTFSMRNKTSGVKLVDAKTGSVVNGPTGMIKYTWEAGDLPTPGLYEAEFKVTYSDSSVETFPNKGFILIKVKDSI